MNESSLNASINLTTKALASQDVLSAELGGEISLLNIKSGIYFTLNPVGASVWRQIQNATSLAQVKQKLLEEYDVGAERCESDLIRLINELRPLGLVELIPA